jgi:acyl-CoA thioesterase FadM
MGHANLRAYGEFFEQPLWHVFHRIGITRSLKMRHEMQHVETGEVCATGELTAVSAKAQEIL